LHQGLDLSDLYEMVLLSVCSNELCSSAPLQCDCAWPSMQVWRLVELAEQDLSGLANWPGRRPVNWVSLSENKSLDWSQVVRNPGLPWVWPSLCRFPQVTRLPDDFVAANDFGAISLICHPDLVRAYPDAGWDYAKLSKNVNMDLQFILEHVRSVSDAVADSPSAQPDEPWEGNHLAMRVVDSQDSLCLADVVAHPNLRWNYRILSKANGSKLCGAHSLAGKRRARR
jgi:hypothetical protein